MSSDILLSEDKTELCMDEARRMLHISKRRCAELLRDCVLPCTSTGKKTRQYRILRSDVEALMKTQGHKKQSDPPKDYREQQLLTVLRDEPRRTVLIKQTFG